RSNLIFFIEGRTYTSHLDVALCASRTNNDDNNFQIALISCFIIFELLYRKYVFKGRIRIMKFISLTKLMSCFFPFFVVFFNSFFIYLYTGLSVVKIDNKLVDQHQILLTKGGYCQISDIVGANRAMMLMEFKAMG